MENIKKRPRLLVWFFVMALVSFSLFYGESPRVLAATQSKTFPESTSRTQTQTWKIPNLKSVVSVTVDTGSVSYTLSGDTLTLTLSNGNPSRQVQTGGTPAGSKTISNYNPVRMYIYTYHNYASSGSCKFTSDPPSTISYGPDSEGYSGTLSKKAVDAWPVNIGSCTTATGASETQFKQDYYYEGTVSKPDTRTYQYYYQYTVTVQYLDNSAPILVISSPSNSQVVSAVDGRRTITISGTVTDTDNNTVTISATINGKTKTTSVTNTSTSKPWSLIWDVVNDNIGQGTYSNIVVTADDGNGGVSTSNYTGTITVDKTNPVITITGVTNGSTYQDSVAPSFSATDSGGSGLASVTATLNGSAYSSGTAITTGGAKTLIVTATDNAGNQSQQTVSFTVNKKPTLTLTTLDNLTLSEIPGFNTYTISGQVNDADVGDEITVKYQIDSNPAQIIATETSSGSPQSFNNDITIDSTIPEGNHVLNVWAEDNKGGISSIESRNFVVDKTPPAAPTFSENPTGQAVSKTVTINFPSDASIKEYKIDDGNWTNYTEPITLTKNATIYARAIDIAGNQSDASHSVTSIGPPNPIVNVVGLSEDSVKVTDTQTYPEPVERQFSILKSGQIVQNSNWTDEEEYTFSGLDPNTIYDVQVDVRFK